jgi:hypothetical protein
MSLRHLMLLLPVVTLSVACFDDKDDDDEDDDDDSGYDWTTPTGYYGTTGYGTTGTTGTTGTGGVPTVSVTWGSSAIDLSVSGGAGAWWFGMAETAGCSDCWTGEDCAYGFELADGSVLAYCHDGTDTGTSLTYGGDAGALAAGTTVFPRSSEGDVTYYLESDPNFGGDDTCWIWGDDVSYYSGLGCTAL